MKGDIILLLLYTNHCWIEFNFKFTFKCCFMIKFRIDSILIGIEFPIMIEFWITVAYLIASKFLIRTNVGVR